MTRNGEHWNKSGFKRFSTYKRHLARAIAPGRFLYRSHSFHRALYCSCLTNFNELPPAYAAWALFLYLLTSSVLLVLLSY